MEIRIARDRHIVMEIVIGTLSLCPRCTQRWGKKFCTTAPLPWRESQIWGTSTHAPSIRTAWQEGLIKPEIHADTSKNSLCNLGQCFEANYQSPPQLGRKLAIFNVFCPARKMLKGVENYVGGSLVGVRNGWGHGIVFFSRSESSNFGA